MSFNHPYTYWYPSQFISGCLSDVASPLYTQPSKGITSILVTQHPKDVQYVDGLKLGHFHPLPWMVCDVPWASTINKGLDTLSIHHYCVHGWGWFTIVQLTRTRGSYQYWSHNTPRMEQHGWMKTNTLLALAWDGGWYTMSYNHQCKYWYPSQFICGCMGWVDRQLYTQPSKGITSILVTQHSKVGPLWMK